MNKVSFGHSAYSEKIRAHVGPDGTSMYPATQPHVLRTFACGTLHNRLYLILLDGLFEVVYSPIPFGDLPMGLVDGKYNKLIF